MKINEVDSLIQEPVGTDEILSMAVIEHLGSNSTFNTTQAYIFITMKNGTIKSWDMLLGDLD